MDQSLEEQQQEPQQNAEYSPNEGNHYEQPQQQQESRLESPPSNEFLLLVAFVSFMGFALVQTVAASIANSKAMMADSVAMIVDALTYLANLIAERQKSKILLFHHHQNENDYQQGSNLNNQSQQQKKILLLELIPPLISVTTLLIVTGIVSRDAIEVLIESNMKDHSNDTAEQEHDPNLNLMLLFSFINLCLDVLNVSCFAKAKHLLGYNTTVTTTTSETNNYNVGDNDDAMERAQEQLLPFNDNSDMHTMNHSYHDLSSEGPSRNANLNMCSAYSHVFADTLRSVAVLIAAGIAKLVDTVSPEIADAVAALIVTLLILFSLVPLFTGIWTTCSSLLATHQQEGSPTTGSTIITNNNSDRK